MKYYGCANTIPKSDKRHAKWRRQRKERGFDDTELWSLDITIARFVYPRLVAFRANVISYPGGTAYEWWKEILDTMIEGFKLMADPDMEWEYDPLLTKKVNKALKLFTKHYFDLWD